MARLIKIAETKDLRPGEGGIFEVEGQKIVVFNVDGRFYAVEDKFHPGETAPVPAAVATRYFKVKASGDDIQLEL